MRNVVCTHLDQIAVRELPASVEGCEDCVRTGDTWLHLRICLTCGHVACCDDSPNRHATAHAHATSHPIIRSPSPAKLGAWAEPTLGGSRHPPHLCSARRAVND